MLAINNFGPVQTVLDTFKWFWTRFKMWNLHRTDFFFVPVQSFWTCPKCLHLSKKKLDIFKTIWTCPKYFWICKRTRQKAKNWTQKKNCNFYIEIFAVWIRFEMILSPFVAEKSHLQILLWIQKGRNLHLIGYAVQAQTFVIDKRYT